MTFTLLIFTVAVKVHSWVDHSEGYFLVVWIKFLLLSVVFVTPVKCEPALILIKIIFIRVFPGGGPGGGEHIVWIIDDNIWIEILLQSSKGFILKSPTKSNKTSTKSHTLMQSNFVYRNDSLWTVLSSLTMIDDIFCLESMFFRWENHSEGRLEKSIEK